MRSGEPTKNISKAHCQFMQKANKQPKKEKPRRDHFSQELLIIDRIMISTVENKIQSGHQYVTLSTNPLLLCRMKMTKAKQESLKG